MPVDRKTGEHMRVALCFGVLFTTLSMNVSESTPIIHTLITYGFMIIGMVGLFYSMKKIKEMEAK